MSFVERNVVYNKNARDLKGLTKIIGVIRSLIILLYVRPCCWGHMGQYAVACNYIIDLMNIDLELQDTVC